MRSLWPELRRSHGCQQRNARKLDLGGCRSWWDVLIIIVALAIFVWLGAGAQRPPLAMQVNWIFGLAVALLLLLVGTGWMLWKQTRFS